MAGARDVRFRVTAEDDATRTLTRVGSAADRAGDKLSRVGRASAEVSRSSSAASGGATKLGAAMGALRAGAAVAVTGIAATGAAAAVAGVNLYSLARSLQMVQNKSAIVFGKSLPKVTAAARRLAPTIGATTTEMTGLMASFGDVLSPMGMTQRSSAALSTRLGTLTAALTQWSGGTRTAADISDRLVGALAGEYDSLQELGILIDQDRIKSILAAQGKSKLTGNALKQAEAQAAVNEIFRQSSAAMKSYSSDANALDKNHQRLRSGFEETRAQLATALTPAFEQFGAWLLDKGIPAIKAFSDQMKRDITPTLDTIKQGITDIEPVVKKLLDDPNTAEGLRYSLIGVAVGVGILAAALAGLGAAATMAMNLVGQIPESMSAIGALAQSTASGLESAAFAALEAGGAFGRWMAGGVAAAGTLAAAIGAATGRASRAVLGVGAAIGRWVEGGIAATGRLGAAIGLAVAGGARRALGAMAALGTAVTRGLSAVVSSVTRIGTQIVDGIVGGLQAGIGRVQAAAARLADAVPGPIRRVLGIASPSRVTMRIGRQTGQGLEIGLRASQDRIRAVITRIAEMTRDRLRRAMERLSTVRGRHSDLAGSVAGAAGAPAWGGDGPVLDRLRAQSQMAARWAGTLRSLRAAGAGSAMLSEIGQAGPEQGQAAATELLRSGRVREASALAARIRAEAAAAGRVVADAVHGSAIAAQQRQVTQARRGLVAAQGGGAQINVTVGMGVAPADVGAQIVRAIREYERRSGRGWRA